MITDGAPNFHQAYRKEFWANTIAERSLHIQHIHFKRDMNNNKMERMNGEIRDREKVMRGLKKMNTPILKGYEIFHNYIRTLRDYKEKRPQKLVELRSMEITNGLHSYRMQVITSCSLTISFIFKFNIYESWIKNQDQ